MNFEITIARMGLEGQGVGTDPDGNIYFVKGAVVGDVVEVEPERLDKRYRDGRLKRLIAASPQRVEPACTHFTQCGGCDWLHWDYSAQVEAKESILRHVLERSQLPPEEFRPMLRAAQTLGYRNRIQVRQQGTRVGFFKKGSRDMVAVDSCAVAHPRLNEAMGSLKAQPSDPRKVELYIREDGEVGHLVDVPHGAGGFSQIHGEQNERLREVVSGYLASANSQSVLELYCGNGNLSFSFPPAVNSFVGVDMNRAALSRAREQLASTSRKGWTFQGGHVDGSLPGKLEPAFAEAYDTLVLDPPRTGVGPGLAEFLHPNLAHVVYVSCSPVSFAKDVQCLKKGFTLRSIQPIDMFPQTRHIEFVAWFSRSS